MCTIVTKIFPYPVIRKGWQIRRLTQNNVEAPLFNAFTGFCYRSPDPTDAVHYNKRIFWARNYVEDLQGPTDYRSYLWVSRTGIAANLFCLFRTEVAARAALPYADLALGHVCARAVLVPVEAAVVALGIHNNVGLANFDGIPGYLAIAIKDLRTDEEMQAVWKGA